MISIILTLSGCDTEEMAESWQIDRLRVLAVASEPAEPRPGDTVRFDALVVSPAQPVAGSAWFVCDAASSDDFGCAIDESLLSGASLEELDPAALEAAGFIGLLPLLPPTWVVPADYLDALSDEAKLEGTFAMTYVAAFPEVPDGEELAEDDVELAYKRVTVSLADTPNHNPAVAAWSVDGLPVAAGAEVRLDPGQAYDIGVELAPDAVETYAYRASDGAVESRTEEPYFSWYLQEGSFNQSTSLWPYTSVVYFAPSDPDAETQSLWVVVRDRRGGMGWSELRIRFSAAQ